MKETVIGILGGMGPEATSELFRRIIKYTPANKDQEHVSTIIINDTQIPDRTNYILGNGENPIPLLKGNLDKLKSAGADVALMPCMTAHTFISELNDTSLPIINAIELVEDYINKHYPTVKNIGLLATTGSVQSKVFNKYISRKIHVPSSVQQKELMNVIYGEKGIKAGIINSETVSTMSSIVESLYRRNIEVVIAGCTELSLILNDDFLNVPVIDPITLLAKRAVELGTSR